MFGSKCEAAAWAWAVTQPMVHCIYMHRELFALGIGLTATVILTLIWCGSGRCNESSCEGCAATAPADEVSAESSIRNAGGAAEGVAEAFPAEAALHSRPVFVTGKAPW